MLACLQRVTTWLNTHSHGGAGPAGPAPALSKCDERGAAGLLAALRPPPTPSEPISRGTISSFVHKIQIKLKDTSACPLEMGLLQTVATYG